MQFKPGMIVKSEAGHDQERFYVVITAEDGYAYIADGKRRKVEKPKCKNICHLSKTNKIVLLSEIDTNKKIRRVLRDYNDFVAPVAK